MATKATRKVLKSLFLMSALAGALLVAGPTQARDRHHGGHEYHHDGGGRGGHGWRGHDDHGWGGHRQYRHGWRGHGWGYQPHAYYPPPRHYYPSHYHQHYRGCGHDGYHHGGLVELLIDYSHHD